MGGMTASRVGCVGALLLIGLLLTQQAAAHKELGSAGPTGNCRMQSDKQATISDCTAVIASGHERGILEKAYNRRGLAYLAIGQFAFAVDDFTQVLRINPAIAGYFDNRQRALVGLGNFDAALRDANSAVKMAPAYSFVYHGRGAVYVDLKRYDLAVQDFNAALAINGNDAPLLVDRGKVFRAIGLIDNALSDFASAHSIDPNFMGALRERGLTYMALGNAAAARADLAQVLASQPAGQADLEVVSAMQQLLPGNDVPSGRALAFSEETQSTNPVTAVPVPPSADDVRHAAEQTVAEQRRKAEQEADAARKEAQALRDEAAAKLRKERFERASTAARGLIDEASAFIKSDPGDPKLLEYVQRIADLNGSLSAANPDDTERQAALLGNALQQDEAFAKFRTERAEEQQRQNASFLADAVHTLAAQKTFVTKVVTREPTSSNAIKLLGLIREADAALAAPVLDPVQTVIGKIDATLQAADLASEFAADQEIQQAVSAAAPSTSQGEAKTQGEPGKAGLQVVGTDKNAFLLKGDLQDVVFLFNTSPKAPHVTRNLRGDIVFGDKRADACLFSHDPDEGLSPLVKATLQSYESAKTIVVAGEPCLPDRLTSYDVIVTRRGTFLRQEPRTRCLWSRRSRSTSSRIW